MNLPFHIICWLKEFLNNRMFSVRINNFITKQELIETGVPQGAVFSPILFSIYTNDIPMNFSKNKFYSLLFTDDLCTFKIYKKMVKIQSQVFKNIYSRKWVKNMETINGAA